MALMRKIGDGAGAGLNLAQVAFLKDEELPDGQPYDIELEYELLTRSWVDHAPAREHPTARQLWAEHGASYLAGYIKAHAGQRPAAWWRFETLDNGGPLLRLKVGGIGTAWGDKQMAYGRPTVFVTEKNKTWWGEAPGPAVDPSNPPLYESQAAFLARHDMLVRGEREKLTEKDYAPEELAVDDDDDE